MAQEVQFAPFDASAGRHQCVWVAQSLLACMHSAWPPQLGSTKTSAPPNTSVVQLQTQFLIEYVFQSINCVNLLMHDARPPAAVPVRCLALQPGKLARLESPSTPQVRRTKNKALLKQPHIAISGASNAGASPPAAARLACSLVCLHLGVTQHPTSTPQNKRQCVAH